MKQAFSSNPIAHYSLLLMTTMILSISCNSSSKLSGGVQQAKDSPKPAVKEEPAATPAEETTADSQPAAETPVVPPAEPAPEPVVEGAIQKGSFTVWTEPQDPKPFQDYSIFIQVALPPNTVNYSLTDLKGYLTGTDEYTQEFGGTIKPRDFQTTSDSALVEVRVPGSYSHVRDTIDVTSKLLNETQQIEIVF